jgi:hypothetical protein
LRLRRRLGGGEPPQDLLHHVALHVCSSASFASTSVSLKLMSRTSVTTFAGTKSRPLPSCTRKPTR